MFFFSFSSNILLSNAQWHIYPHYPYTLPFFWIPTCLLYALQEYVSFSCPCALSVCLCYSCLPSVCMFACSLSVFVLVYKSECCFHGTQFVIFCRVFQVVSSVEHTPHTVDLCVSCIVRLPPPPHMDVFTVSHCSILIIIISSLAAICSTVGINVQNLHTD